MTTTLAKSVRPDADHPQPPKRFLVLDTMRGFAALSIMVYHTHFWGSNTYIAVDFFLALSGFVLAHAYFSKPDFNLLEFAWFRFARLYPLHIVTFLAMLLLYELQGRYINTSAVALNTLMIQNIGFGPWQLWFNSPAWSISVEYWTNMLIAAVFVLAGSGFRRGRLKWILLLAASCFGWSLLAVELGSIGAHKQKGGIILSLAMMRGIAAFGVGIVVYDIYLWLLPRLQAHHKKLIGWITPILLVVFVCSMWLLVRRTLLDFIFVPMYAVIILACAFEEGRVAKLVGRYAYLGSISFAVYLAHVPVKDYLLMWLTEDTPLLLRLAIIFPAVLIVSILIHHFFEMPVYRWLRALPRSGSAKLKKLMSA